MFVQNVYGLGFLISTELLTAIVKPVLNLEAHKKLLGTGERGRCKCLDRKGACECDECSFCAHKHRSLEWASIRHAKVKELSGGISPPFSAKLFQGPGVADFRNIFLCVDRPPSWNWGLEIVFKNSNEENIIRVSYRDFFYYWNMKYSIFKINVLLNSIVSTLTTTQKKVKKQVACQWWKKETNGRTKRKVHRTRINGAMFPDKENWSTEPVLLLLLLLITFWRLPVRGWPCQVICSRSQS